MWIWDLLVYFYDRTFGLIISLWDEEHTASMMIDVSPLDTTLFAISYFAVAYVLVPVIFYVIDQSKYGPEKSKYTGECRYTGYKDKKYLNGLVCTLLAVVACDTALFWVAAKAPEGYMPIPPIERAILAYPILLLISKWKFKK